MTIHTDAVHSSASSEPPATGQSPGATAPPTTRGRLKAMLDAIGAAFGAVLGLAPHVLHHVGFIAGAALITGAAGNALFFVVGLVFSIPLLRRVYRRFRTWRAPAIAIAVFAAMFSLSAFVIGPAISGDPSTDNRPDTPSRTPSPDHASHHSE